MSFPWNYRDQHYGICWIKAEVRTEKPGSWRQLIHTASFNLFVCPNFGVWLEVTLGNNGTRAEPWERKCES